VNAHVILNSEDIRRAVRRIAHEIIERNKDLRSIVLVGLHTRGVPLAQRLASAIEEFEGQRIAVGTLDIGLYRDDLAQIDVSRALIQPTEMPTDIEGKNVILVDDVSSPAAASAPPSTPSRTSGARPRSSSPCSSTGVTANCQSAPITWARTYRLHSTKTYRSCSRRRMPKTKCASRNRPRGP
jgi:hypothetical protein